MRLTHFVLLLFSFSACSQKKAEKPDATLFLPAQELSELKNKKLEEVSGLAASAVNPGMLWTHNDSGGKAEAYLVDTKLDIRLTCRLKGLRNRDWEDITVGPGPEMGKYYVYVGEIGDNLAQFEYKYIYRFEEPKLTPGLKEYTVTRFDTITFRLEDGKKDTEAILIHPKTKDLYVISKREEPVYLYQLPYPYSTRDTLVAKKKSPIPYTQVVAASISPDGKELLIKNYRNVYYWKISPDSLLQKLKARPYILPYKEEPQGEAITFARDGSGYFTLSEKLKGEKTFLNFYKRR